MSQHLWEAPRDLRLMLARQGYSVDDAIWRCLQSSAVLVLVSLVSIGFNQLYEFHVSSSRELRAKRFVESTGTALALTVGTLLLVHFSGARQLVAFPGLGLSQRVQTLVVSMLTAFSVLYLWRNVFHWGMRKLDWNQRVLILGSLRPAQSLTLEILKHPEAGYVVAGLVREPQAEMERESRAGPSLTQPQNEEAEARSRSLVVEDYRLPGPGEKEDSEAEGGEGNGNEAGGLLALTRRLAVDIVVVAIGDRRTSLPTHDLLRCRLAGIDVREREELYEEITGKLAVEAMRPSYLIFNEGFRRHTWTELVKRIFDVVLATSLALVTWPIMIIAAILVRLDTPGPVLFRQERVGQDGRAFVLMKFRSMRLDAEKDTGPVWTSEDDPRITRSGRFMRKTRIDELPQLLNVIAGSMSLVGPRPERQHFIDELAEKIPYFAQRHIVKPGLTGWAQINYPYGNTFEDALNKLQFDLFYIKNHSLLFDLSILFNTIKTVVLRQGT
jgi:lipopolysaccharide/colanic/teichoic acid biosynthesis glycosyltransferase